ncbi:hypothetical protein [Streptomyces niveus]
MRGRHDEPHPVLRLLIHDVLGSLTAGALTALIGYSASRIKRRTARPPDQSHTPE